MLFNEFNDLLKKDGIVIVSSSNSLFDDYRFILSNNIIDVFKNNTLDESYGDVYNAFWDHAYMLNMISTKQHHKSKTSKIVYGSGS